MISCWDRRIDEGNTALFSFLMFTSCYFIKSKKIHDILPVLKKNPIETHRNCISSNLIHGNLIVTENEIGQTQQYAGGKVMWMWFLPQNITAQNQCFFFL